MQSQKECDEWVNRQIQCDYCNITATVLRHRFILFGMLPNLFCVDLNPLQRQREGTQVIEVVHASVVAHLFFYTF